SFYHSIIQSFYHSIIQSFYHSIIQSFYHSVIQSFLINLLKKRQIKFKVLVLSFIFYEKLYFCVFEFHNDRFNNRHKLS
ncbi:MAG: hypothetical protein JXL97_15845, partial [Bacteroidales bacterium]|nr:hypothetical protein [Bacteroidales bacterium]